MYENDARLMALCEDISHKKDLPRSALAGNLSEDQIAEIERIYGKSFKTCRPHFEHAFRNFFYESWWPAKLQFYGEEFVMGTPESLRINLVRAGVMRFLETQWLGAGDHDAEEVRSMRHMVQYYRSELIALTVSELDDLEDRRIQPNEAVLTEEYKDMLCDLLKEAIPEDTLEELVNEFI